MNTTNRERAWDREEVVVLVTEYFRTKTWPKSDIERNQQRISDFLRRREEAITGLAVSDFFRNYSGIQLQSSRVRCLDPDDKHSGMRGTKLQAQVVKEYCDNPQRIIAEANLIYEKYSGSFGIIRGIESYKGFVFDWTEGDMLGNIVRSLAVLFQYSDYVVEKNRNVSEASVNIRKRNENENIVRIWPWLSERKITLQMRTTIIEQLKSLMDLPKSTEVKPGRYPGWRNLVGVSVDLCERIIMALAKELQMNPNSF